MTEKQRNEDALDEALERLAHSTILRPSPASSTPRPSRRCFSPTWPAREIDLPEELPARDELIDRAAATGDEHAIKFTETCLREDAIEALQGGLEKDPRSDLLHYYLAKAYERKNRPEDAIEYYEQAIETTPEFEDALVCLATLYEKAGMRHKSVEIWQRVLSTTPDAAPRERIKSHIMELL